MDDDCSVHFNDWLTNTNFTFIPLSSLCLLAPWVWWVPARHKRKRQCVVLKSTGSRTQTTVDWIHWAAQGKSCTHKTKETCQEIAIPFVFATCNEMYSYQGWICECVCMCFLSEYQRGQERKGHPGDNNHPSTTGASVGVCRTLGYN